MLKTQTRGSVPGQTFEGMQRVARREDIDRGGLYDSRSGAINIWCSPEDKPAGYNYEIVRGALAFPRDYIATVTPKRKRPEDHKVYLELEVDPERGGTEPPGRRVEPTEEEINWAREKLDDLVRMGEEEGVLEEILVCPLCGKNMGAVAFNDFVRHVVGHAKVILVGTRAEGNVIYLADGRALFPSDYVRKRVRK